MIDFARVAGYYEQLLADASWQTFPDRQRRMLLGLALDWLEYAEAGGADLDAEVARLVRMFKAGR